MGPLNAPQTGRAGPSGLLDGPPPHPQTQSPFGGGSQSIGAMGVSGARALPMEVLAGLIQSGSQIGDMLDTLAQTAPDIAPELAAAKDMLQRGLAKLTIAGGGITPSGPLSGPLPGEMALPRTGP